MTFYKQPLIYFIVVFVYALSVFSVISDPLLRQIARYLPHQSDEFVSKSLLKSLDEKVKTVSDFKLSPFAGTPNPPLPTVTLAKDLVTLFPNGSNLSKVD